MHKRPYSRPKLVRYGKVQDITQRTTGRGFDLTGRRIISPPPPPSTVGS
jgi:hypothetical protein